MNKWVEYTKMCLCGFQREGSNRLVSDHIGAEWEINKGKIFLKTINIQIINQRKIKWHGILDNGN